MAIEVRGLAPLLQVFDMPASITFYRDVLGFRIVGTDGKTVPDNDWVLLELDGTQVMLNTAYESRCAALST
jgi:catechol 2,3-dioxygenase-like lactoylglutathione lyase family enzyme